GALFRLADDAPADDRHLERHLGRVDAVREVIAGRRGRTGRRRRTGRRWTDRRRRVRAGSRARIGTGARVARRDFALPQLVLTQHGQGDRGIGFTVLSSPYRVAHVVASLWSRRWCRACPEARLAAPLGGTL